MDTNTTLTSGFFLGIRRSIRNFSFTLPKIGRGVTDTDMNTWFSQLNSGRKVTASAPAKHNPKDEKSTSFSGWIKTDNAINLSAKCLAAPEIYLTAAGEDPNLAQEKVKSFKKKATAVLSRCCESEEAVTEAIAAEINKYACLVHEIKIVVLHVSDTSRPGYRHDSNTNMWYLEKTVRKFYLEDCPTDKLLRKFAEEIADPTTTVNAECKLVVVRSDRATQGGRNAHQSSFTIRSVSDDEARFTDAKLLAAAERIRKVIETKTTTG